MAELCIKCFNEINKTDYTENDVVVEYDICENCRKNLPCVMFIRSDNDE